MAGSGITAGLLQSLHVKLEPIPDSLMESTTYTDFIGAGKIVDNTSATTFITNIAAVVDTDQPMGGAAIKAETSEQTFGNFNIITGFSMEDLEFEVVRNRKNTFRKAIEDVKDSTACWMAFLSQDVPGHSGAAADATIKVGWGTIATHPIGKVNAPSTIMVTISPIAWSNAIDA